MEEAEFFYGILSQKQDRFTKTRVAKKVAEEKRMENLAKNKLFSVKKE